MQRSPKVTEQSMDEILASIRKIIAEDPAAAPSAQPAPQRAPSMPPGAPHAGPALPHAAGQRPAPEGGGERRRSADLEADLADLLGSITPRNTGLPGGPPSQADADAKRQQRPAPRANGSSPPAAASQRHRPLTEALNRARAAERDPGAEAAPQPPSAQPQAARATPPPPIPPPPSEPSPGRVPPAPPPSAQAADARHPAPEPARTSEPSADAPAANAQDARSRQSDPAKAGQPPADAVSAAAAAVARKVAATMPVTPVASRPFMASRTAATGEGGRTLEDTVAEMLRPMLRQWLETNMPRIVEKALKTELGDNVNPPKAPASGNEQS